jgi:hypothetical protein
MGSSLTALAARRAASSATAHRIPRSSSASDDARGAFLSPPNALRARSRSMTGSCASRSFGSGACGGERGRGGSARRAGAGANERVNGWTNERTRESGRERRRRRADARGTGTDPQQRRELHRAPAPELERGPAKARQRVRDRERVVAASDAREVIARRAKAAELEHVHRAAELVAASGVAGRDRGRERRRGWARRHRARGERVAH